MFGSILFQKITYRGYRQLNTVCYCMAFICSSVNNTCARMFGHCMDKRCDYIMAFFFHYTESDPSGGKAI